MSTSPLKIGFNVPFAEAIKAAQQRKVVLPDTYYGELQGLARQQAFTVASLASLDQLTIVKDSLAATLQKGQTFRQWQKDITESGTLDLPKYRLDNIFRTNIQSNYNRGRWERFVESKATRPYVMYDAINDSRVRPTHLAMDGIIRPIDDNFWKTHAPLNGYRSLLPSQRVSGNILLGLKAFYSGKAVEISFKSGGSITVTTQHPILTNTGWVMSNEIKIGDKIACYSGEISSSSPPTNLDIDNPPPTIEQVFNTLSTHIRTTAPRATVNLYGDVEFIDGDVEIVGADRELMRQIDATTRKLMDQIKLSLTDKVITKTSCLSPFMSIFSSSRFFRGLRRFFCPLRNLFSPMVSIPFCLGRNNNTIIRKKFGDSFSTHIKLCGDASNSPAIDVYIYDAFWYWLQEFRSRLSNEPSRLDFSSLSFGSFKSSITDIFIGSFGVNADALGSIRDAHPGKVKFDDIVDIRLFDYTGHVYDLETKSGNILAYGGECNNHYILSNCRCRLISLSEGQAQARSGNGTGLNKGVDASKMEPDKGFDYNPGEDLLAGVNRGIESRAATAPAKLVQALDEKLKAPNTYWQTGTQQAPWHDTSFIDSPDWIKEAIKKHDGDFKGLLPFNPKNGAYHFNGSIHMAKLQPSSYKDQGTWRHEYGHYIDKSLAGTGFSHRSAMPDFTQAMNNDTDAIIKASGLGRKSAKLDNFNAIRNKNITDLEANVMALSKEERKSYLSGKAEKIGLTLDEIEAFFVKETVHIGDSIARDIRVAYLATAIENKDAKLFMGALSAGIENLKNYNKGLIGKFSDTIGSASKNKLLGMGTHGNGGHTNKYYNDRAGYGQQTEVFANLTCLIGSNSKVWEVTMDYFYPTLATLFKDILK